MIINNLISLLYNPYCNKFIKFIPEFRRFRILDIGILRIMKKSSFKNFNFQYIELLRMIQDNLFCPLLMYPPLGAINLLNLF